MSIDMESHLKSRGMNTSLYTIEYGENCATFYLYNPARKLVGYHRYNPLGSKKTNKPAEAKYYTRLPKETDGLFGLEQDRGGTLFIVEGIFKAAALHREGFNAVAVLGATPKRLKSQFKIWRAHRPLIAIGDNDKAGASLVRLVKRGVQSPIDLDEMNDLFYYTTNCVCSFG